MQRLTMCRGTGEGSLTWSYEFGDDQNIHQGIGKMSAEPAVQAPRQKRGEDSGHFG